ncbi:MAG: hypothetical protein CL924_03385 [Deltaproteobacteria bacterium]|nr:MAG: hypothetical protein CL924_03385 [Deltaproteobacteria bacterium]
MSSDSPFSNYSEIQATFYRLFLNYWTALFLLSIVSASCASGSGKFYDWCAKRDFPAICKKYFD